MDKKTPDVTLAQILAAFSAVGGLLVDGTVISGQQEKLIVGIASVVLPIIWTLADALIRSARAHAHATIVAAQTAAATQAVVTASPKKPATRKPAAKKPAVAPRSSI